MAVLGYVRVSSRTQSDGFGLDVQRAAVEGAGATRVFGDVMTGTTMERPGWTSLMGELAAGDTLVVARLDRIARSALAGCAAVRDLVSRGVAVRVLNMGLVEDTPAGRMMLTVMFAMAEFERDAIVERLAEGRAAARERGVRFGRPPAEPDMDAARAVLDAGGTMSEAAEAAGTSRRTLGRRLGAWAG